MMPPESSLPSQPDSTPVPEPDVEPPPLPPPPPEPLPRRSTASKLLGLLLVILCFEIGVFLVVFPWMDAWGRNWIPVASPQLVDLWESNYFRGALSGLGFINIWISFQEMLRLLRG